MNGKNFIGKVKVDIETMCQQKTPIERNTITTKKLSCLYQKYLDYNPDLGKLLKKQNIDNDQYLQFLILLLKNIESEEN